VENMTEDRNRRFWTRVLIAFLVGVGLYFVYVLYAVIQIGEEFKASIRD
jgi:hypothetical protein